MLLLGLLLCLGTAYAMTDCDFWYIGGASEKVRTDYWITVGPAGIPDDAVSLSYYFWQNCGPAFPDVVSRWARHKAM